MNVFTALLAFFHCSSFRNSDFFHWLMGHEHYEKSQHCACKGKWNKYSNTKHGDTFCSRVYRGERYE